ncbi:Aminodeoxychorismate synthase component 1 [Rubripirellula obstinata]|uniref:Aminodeoxychorismate synthase component 1 n=1 Tax=Rubripirellula obstinata TaxID=406547 RepID=A0A5B1CSP3_9BACT|nr:anthranilate synthase component I family protein [Rubripirellula obstinata]KAA1262234.1 Aminodeoxychorismate synthase component 1 [Rubripirellula obstinata]
MPNAPVSIFSKQLGDHFSIADVFDRFAGRPGCLWLDSAATAPDRLVRYSFLCSDPTETLVAESTGSDPWPLLSQWCSRLPGKLRPDLPPFQGGIAGLLGYEAGGWLDATGPAPICAAADGSSTPPMSLGWYPWTIAVDHHRGQAWIIAHSEPDLAFAESILSSDAPAPISNPRHQTSHSISSCPEHATGVDGVVSNFSSQEFRDAVNEIVNRIRAGDSFQVNLAQRLTTAAVESSPSLYLRLREANPAPFAAYYNGGGFQVLSSSPEGFLQVREGHVETRPIKGTVSRSADDQLNQRLANELTASEKDRAENVMIVDLMRNDLSRVCTDDSVNVTQLCELETYQYVQHLVSVVEGDLGPSQDAVSLLKACFPGGSVTGAPKIEAMRTIAELEHHPRGPYCGSIGYISTPLDADFNILIRTITAIGGRLHLPVGGGITARSDAAKEEAETWTKAEGMLRAVLPTQSEAE